MSENQNAVSIVIASYNSAAYLAATLASCLEQSVPAREVILIDDGSTDDTSTVIGPFLDRITYVPIPNGGVSAARNEGARRATGDWLLFLDSDDILLPTAIESLLKAATKTPAGVAYGMVLQHLEPPLEARLSGFNYCEGAPPFPAQKNLYRCAIITPGSAIVKASLHQKIGGFISGYEPLEDRDYWIKCGLFEPVAFHDGVVLDKTWRPFSAGSQDAKRVFRSLTMQRNLRAWCGERKIDFSWAPSDAGFAEHAVKEALYFRTDSILAPILAESRACGYTGLWYWRAKLQELILRLTGRLSAAPAWIHEKPRLA